jgi:predicted naringenin-chalcone synthase
MYTVLESIATANPPFKRTQAEAAGFMSRIQGLSDSTRRCIGSIYDRSGIDYRYSCLSDYGSEPEDFEFYPNNWSLTPFPTTADRNQKYQICAGAIAESAAQQALWQADLEAVEITHLIVVSCTGFSAPGVDLHLIQCLGLPTTVERTLVGFMGCHAALNGLKIAHSICQSNAQAKVLLVCVELCSLHFQIEDSLESVVVNAIFSDGAAAAILRSSSLHQARGKLAYTAGYSQVIQDELDLMNWTIGDSGFLMGLSPQVPDVIQRYLPAYLEAFLGRHQLAQDAVDFWAIHPGGRRIVETIQSVLLLADGRLRDSFEVLRLYGNMSSPTILFVLQRLLAQHESGVKDGNGFQSGIALAFGPGLSIEGCLFQQVGGVR